MERKTKICKTCKEEKPLDAFYLISPGKGRKKVYRRGSCKKCTIKKRMEKYYIERGLNNVKQL